MDTEQGRTRLPFDLNADGTVYPIYCYDKLPDGARWARTTDLIHGKPVLYKVSIGPDKGKFHTDIVRKSTYHLLIEKINAGDEVYIGGVTLEPIPKEENEEEDNDGTETQ